MLEDSRERLPSLCFHLIVLLFQPVDLATDQFNFLDVTSDYA